MRAWRRCAGGGCGPAAGLPRPPACLRPRHALAWLTTRRTPTPSTTATTCATRSCRCCAHAGPRPTPRSRAARRCPRRPATCWPQATRGRSMRHATHHRPRRQAIRACPSVPCSRCPRRGARACCARGSPTWRCRHCRPPASPASRTTCSRRAATAWRRSHGGRGGPRVARPPARRRPVGAAARGLGNRMGRPRPLPLPGGGTLSLLGADASSTADSACAARRRRIGSLPHALA